MHLSIEDLSINQWKCFKLINDHGMEVSFLNYGGIITKIVAPDRFNNFENVVLGYQEVEDYVNNPNFFGALVGRVAGRIQGAEFQLNGKVYTLISNDGINHLHGGASGFHQIIWKAWPFEKKHSIGVVFSTYIPHGDGGYPGNLEMSITYTLYHNNIFTMTYEAVSDKDTVLAPTNHTYFNLSGDLKSVIRNHRVLIDSSRFGELNPSLIPTGNILEVNGTVFDFRNGRYLGDGMNSDHIQNQLVGDGYDHYFIFDQNKKEKIIVEDSNSGRVLTINTDAPGCVMYTSNGLDNQHRLNERLSKKYLGVCFETQTSPASLHHKRFPPCILRKGEAYFSKTSYCFGVSG